MSLARFQLPYLTTAQREALTPLDKDLLFDTDLNKIFRGDGVTPGGIELLGGDSLWEADGVNTIKPGENLNIQAAANNLKQGEIYLITDENRLAMGLTVNTYEVYMKYSETARVHVGTSAPADTTMLWYNPNDTPAAATDEKVKYNASDTAAGYLADKIKAGTGISLAEGTGDDADTLIVTNTGSSSATGEIWTALTAAYASATTFTFTGTDKDVNLIQLSLLTLTDSAGTTRRIGYVKSAVNNSGTITATVVTDTDLASNDKDFKVAWNRKVNDYQHLISIPGEQISDTAYSQGTWLQDLPANSFLLPVDASVLTAAAGSGAALTFQVYKNTTALFSSAPDLATNTVLRSQRPTTNTLSAAENISLRIMSSAGATNKASDFQAKLYMIPQLIFTAF